jgi:hypothetical protein
MTLSIVEQKIFDAAIRNLRALNFDYAIIDREGHVHGTLEIEQKKKKTVRPHVNRQRWNIHKPLVLAKLRDMVVGSVVAFPIPADDPDEDAWRSLLCNSARQVFKGAGGEAFTTCISKDRRSIEVIRLE